MKHIDLDILYPLLFKVSKPGRYTGSEYGSIVKDSGVINIAVSYPDLYEIAMSNISVRRLYSLLNSIEGVSCERVFAPAPDLEEELRKSGIPLFSIETRRAISGFDIIGFSIGYELLATNVINILELGGMSPLVSERTHDDPIVIAGGTAVTNPLPFARFIDCAFIGEAEDFIFDVVPRLVDIKKRGGGKEDLFSVILDYPSVWAPGISGKKVKKSVWQGFSESEALPLLPVPNIKPVHEQGSVELMRGCPNGCRFCHSGIFYRPFRQKRASLAVREVEKLVFDCGYSKISLLSLSTGDYRGIDLLAGYLAKRYGDLGVSFSLPSLRVESMTLGLLSDIKEVRKSGLTFAVETPADFFQAGINKRIPREKIIEILGEAKREGFRGAKFYFMLGLPVYEGDETDMIADYITGIQEKTRMKININIGTFVPKPHTPFERASQLAEDEARNRIMRLRRRLQGRAIKVSYHSPFASFIEGMISRCDERAGDIILSAFRKGARLDAWEEHLSDSIWREAISEAGWDVARETCRKRERNETLPWHDISLGVDNDYLLEECDKSLEGKLTDSCLEGCPAPCGACTDEAQIVNAILEDPGQLGKGLKEISIDKKKKTRLLFAFSKKETSVFLSHLNVMTIFEESLLRSGYFAVFSGGFNPHPVMEFASPLQLGFEALEEIVSLEIHNFDSEGSFIEAVNAALPAGFAVTRVKELKPYVTGEKKHSLASLFWGSDYFITDIRSGGLSHVGLFSKLNNKVIEESSTRDPDFPVDTFFLMNNGIYIRYRKIEKKESNVSAFFKRITGSDFVDLGLKIARLKCLAENAKGEAASYFEVCE